MTRAAYFPALALSGRPRPIAKVAAARRVTAPPPVVALAPMSGPLSPKEPAHV